jgi:DNA invertase Pin-like site-specific DNA recombinase
METCRLGYVRVSVTGPGLEVQTGAVTAAGVDRVYVDDPEGAEGAGGEWPELARLLAEVGVGDVVVVWRLDRIARSTADVIATVGGLGQRGVGFASLVEGLDTTGPAGRVVFGVLEGLAALERDVVGERTAMLVARARERGVEVGRPVKITPEMLESAVALLAAGHSKAGVARVLGVSRPTLYFHLARHTSPGTPHAADNHLSSVSPTPEGRASRRVRRGP